MTETTRITKRRKLPQEETTKIRRQQDDSDDDLVDQDGPEDEMWDLWAWWESQS